MTTPQPGILAPGPTASRSLVFQLVPDEDPTRALQALCEGPSDPALVVGVGAPLALALAADVPGLRGFPSHAGAGVSVPSTQSALWCWLRGDDRGDLVHAGRELEAKLEGAFELERCIDTFVYREGRDLSGYVDGTENPTGDDAAAAGILAGAGSGLDGSSFVAVQQWLHDLDSFERMSLAERDDVIGRRQSDDVELRDAPLTAHVKRTAQEDFDPPAFLVRRSMPWADAEGEGLLFIAFGRSFDAFEAQLRRMVGADDGIVDALFRFTRPINGSFFWCPPVAAGALDLSALGI